LKYLYFSEALPKISEISLGTMMFGWRVHEAQAIELISLARDLGINLIDTSISYGQGKSHELISLALKKIGGRSDFVLATKVGGRSNDMPLSTKYITKRMVIEECNLSLKQLCTDYVDLLQLHYPPQKIQYAEIFEAVNALKNQGKIRDFGVCNFHGEDIENFLNFEANCKPVCHQFEANLFNAVESDKNFYFAKKYNLNTVTWGLLSSGLLTDWYIDNVIFRPGSRLDLGREGKNKIHILNSPKTKEFFSQIKNVIAQLNMTFQELCVLWMLSEYQNNCILLGPSNIRHLKELYAFYDSCNQRTPLINPEISSIIKKAIHDSKSL
jgi:aryl-alcohol dehydrogenase-like predicted oxidoreductase